MGCVCSNGRVHVHRRKGGVRKIPDEVTQENASSLLDANEFDKWLNKSDAMQGQYAWVKLSEFVDAYWWSVVVLTVASMAIAHIGAAIEPWSTCTAYPDKDDFSVWCSIGWHLFCIPIAAFWLAVSFYGLTRWSHEEIRFISTMIGWSNLVAFSNACVEFLILCITSRNDENPDWQNVVFIVYVWALFALVGYGFYVQYRINIFLHPITQDYRLQYPSTEEELVSLVKLCYHNGMKMRMVGSQHSQKAAIWGDNTSPAASQGTSLGSNGTTMVSLDNYRDIVSFDESSKRVTVEGGIILGETESKSWSKYKNGLCAQIDKKGWALPDLGGVVKQSAAGFTAMGCAGGSLVYAYMDSIYEIRLIDGKGEIRTFTRPADIVTESKNDDDVQSSETSEPDNPFWGVAVSMGLMGVISTITYQCVPKYNIIGSQVTFSVDKFASKGDQLQADGVGKVNFHAKENSDPESVYNLFMSKENKTYKTQYSRFYWYPQCKDDWIVLWKGHREIESDSKQKEYSVLYPQGEFKSKYYFEIDKNPIVSHMAQEVIHFLFNIFGNAVNKRTHKVNETVAKIVDWVISFTVDPKQGGAETAQQVFGANWYMTLPMDQKVNDKLMPFEFTELWVDIEDTTKAVNACWEYFNGDDRLNRTGIFGWEFYCAKKGHAWIRPGFDRDSFRVDILWFDIETRVPYSFYNQFWEFLIEKGIDFRPHWGKWVPAGDQAFPKNKDPKKRGFNKWSDYYKSVLPKYNSFINLRTELDPTNVFLTQYWAKTLGIEMTTVNVHGNGGDNVSQQLMTVQN